MDAVYAVVESMLAFTITNSSNFTTNSFKNKIEHLGLHFFIPIIAICVICGSIYFARSANNEEEYLHTASAAKESKRSQPILLIKVYCLFQKLTQQRKSPKKSHNQLNILSSCI